MRRYYVRLSVPKKHFKTADMLRRIQVHSLRRQFYLAVDTQHDGPYNERLSIDLATAWLATTVIVVVIVVIIIFVVA